ncbi:hypothetical protein LWI29_008416 [Acer saccharum]|uniref:Uncharacterized protein n=1 Tax=Acer saccharum TaxID=4024 RepID=A0AA39VD14_ACESA|nr:hypothetical protein LWI29_008416 [Acer saccharum]
MQICKHNLIGFVVGYPYLRTTPNASMINTFVDDLYKTGKFEGFNYTFWDEQFATKLMKFQWKHHLEFLLEHMNLPQHISKQIIDRFIAVRILQGYLKSMPEQLYCFPRSGVI